MSVIVARVHDVARIAADDFATHAWDRAGHHIAWGTIGRAPPAPPHAATTDPTPRATKLACAVDRCNGLPLR